MARVKLDLPGNFIFSTNIPVRVSDVNYGGHLGNDAVLSVAHESRIRFFKSLGYTELDVEGLGIIMTDAVVVYKSQAFQGDVLTVDIALGDLEKKGYDMFYRMTKDEGALEVARIKTGFVFFDYSAGKVSSVPPGFSSRFFPETDHERP
jgi:acyl-CoA thioesterase FadM